jgi:hypothetical protein
VAQKKDDSQAARDERARRLREQIAELESGKPAKPSKRKKSIREQVDEASQKLKPKPPQA